MDRFTSCKLSLNHQPAIHKNLLVRLTSRNVGAGVEEWDCRVAAVASLKAKKGVVPKKGA